jgi:transposase
LVAVYQHGIRITISRRQAECHKGPLDRALYRLRDRIEWLVNQCEQFRGLATRYEQRAATYRAMWLIGGTILW